ncbi:OsmC family protein [bacterium]|nr:OsmC family protein [bacterium]
MVGITGKYIGNKRVSLIHGPSESEILTDAPKDNAGEGAYFSPTDLVAAALGSCIMTTLAIYGEKHSIDFTGMYMSTEKHMSDTPPRRIAKLPVTLHLPKALPLELREKIEHVAHACPVHRSLHPEVSAEIAIHYDV